MKIVIAATHCYPGCAVRVEEDEDNARALIEFGDGTIVLGEFTRDDGMARLSVPDYRTARGTQIEPKLWSLQPDEGPGSWRIKARVSEA